MLLSEAGADLLRYGTAECGHTPNTIRAYRQGVRRFREWLAAQGMPDPEVRTVTPALARRYMYHLDGLGLRPRTRINLFLPLRALYKMLLDHGAVTSNPFLEVRLPKKDAARRLLVSDEELAALLDAAGRQPDPKRVARDHALLSVLIFCGLRRAEVLDLKVGDIDLASGGLLVRRGKGQKSRRIWLCPEAKSSLARWLQLRPPCKHEYLFIVDYNRRLAEEGLKAVLDMLKAIAGLGDAPHVACHSIRHAAATRLMRNGADLSSIQHFLGHSLLQTTAIYLHTDEEQLQKIAGLASFRPAASPSAAETEAGSRHQPETDRRRFQRARVDRRR